MYKFLPQGSVCSIPLVVGDYAVVVFSLETFLGEEVAWLSASSTALAGAFAFPKGYLPCVSLKRMTMKPVMTQIQYRL